MVLHCRGEYSVLQDEKRRDGSTGYCDVWERSWPLQGCSVGERRGKLGCQEKVEYRVLHGQEKG